MQNQLNRANSGASILSILFILSKYSSYFDLIQRKSNFVFMLSHKSIG